MKRCNWCARFVHQDQPAFTWYRHFSPLQNVDSAWVEVGPVLGWTDPQVLCPECAEHAYLWRSCHLGLFAEVES
jgi:hypothetical protein